MSKVINVSSITVLDGTVQANESINIMIFFDNPDNIKIEKFYINNVLATVTGGNQITTVTLAVKLISEGGYLSIEFNSYSYNVQNETFVLTPYGNLTSGVMILGSIDIVSVELESGLPYLVLDNEEYITIKIYNPTNYIIESVNGNFDTNFIQVDSSTIRVKSNGNSEFTVTSITYGIEEYTNTIYFDDVIEYYPSVTDGTIYYIYTPSDLLNIQSGRVYLLANDIDFNYLSIESIDFNGILIGNGHKISNLVLYNQSSLFSNFSGYLGGIEFENVYYSYSKNYLSSEYTINVNLGVLVTSLPKNSVLENIIISNSTASVSLTGGSGKIYSQISFIAGYNSGIVRNILIVSSKITHNSTNVFAGFFVGDNRSSATALLLINSEYNANPISGFWTNYLVGREPTGYSYGLYYNSTIYLIPEDYQIFNVFLNNIDLEDLNNQKTYIENLGWDDTIWDFTNIDIANEVYPVLIETDE